MATSPRAPSAGIPWRGCCASARQDDKIKAVVLRVDSPGGSVTASEQIYREVQALRKAGKPVVVSMANYAASGGYYISAPADEIWASPATITGSIGIFAEVPNINRTLAKFGVGVDGLGTTPIVGQSAASGCPAERFGPHADADLSWTTATASSWSAWPTAATRPSPRSMRSARDESGRAWMRSANGLVDHLGLFDDAVKAAAQRAHVTDYKVQFLEPELSWAQSLAMEVKVRAVRVLASTGLADLTGLAPLSPVTQLVQATPLAREAARLSHLNQPNRLYAYCFCTAQ